MNDLAISIGLFGVAGTAALAYLGRAVFAGRLRSARIERGGSSWLLGRDVQEVGYFALQPFAGACVRLGVGANAITGLSLVLGAAAGVAIALGHLGLAGVLAALSFLGDALDGMVARASGTASNAGELLDAVVDRLVEFFLFAGIYYYLAYTRIGSSLTLLALLGSFMVSHTTAEAERLGVDAPRGLMRRAERAVYMTVGVSAVPIAHWLAARAGASVWIGDLPLFISLGLVGIISNVSTVLRVRAVARSESESERNSKKVVATNGLSLRLLGRHQVAAIVATCIDFGTMVALVELLSVPPELATAVGAVVGGLTNFFMGRRWVFSAESGALPRQALRYALVSLASAGWNTLGEYVVVRALGVQYLLGRIAVAVCVSIGWNFPLHRSFVFGEAKEQTT